MDSLIIEYKVTIFKLDIRNKKPENIAQVCLKL